MSALSELSSLRTRLADLLTAASIARGGAPRPPSRTEQALDLLEEMAMKIILSRIYTRMTARLRSPEEPERTRRTPGLRSWATSTNS